MIRILYMSDLHLEMERWRLAVPGWAAFRDRHGDTPRHPSRGPILAPDDDIDLIVLAGDISSGLRGIVYGEQLSAYLNAPAVYVAGNHEFYFHDIDRLLPAAAKAAAHSGGRVQFLENAAASFMFRGERLTVLGATLWTDYEINGDVEGSRAYAERRMNDFRTIEAAGARFSTGVAIAHHQASRLFLHKSLGALHKAGERTLIVTHHAPDGSCLGTRTGPIAPAYASDLLPEFAPYAPAAWIHGHTHFRHDHVQDGIRLLSAPRGYVTHDGPAALDYQPGILELP
jgi:hypothetical protein